MKKNKAIGIFIIVALTICFTACVNTVGTQNSQSGQGSQDGQQGSSSDIEQGGSINMENTYTELIQQYTDAIEKNRAEKEAGTFNFDPNNTGIMGPNLDVFTGSSDRTRSAIYYATKDIDENGVPELFVGMRLFFQGENNPIEIQDIWTIDNGQPIKIFSNKLDGRLLLGGHGEFAQWGNTGSTGYDIYKIGSDGKTPENVGMLQQLNFADDAEAVLGKQVEVPAYSFTDASGVTKQITKDEYNEKLNNYAFADDSATLLDWVQFAQ